MKKVFVSGVAAFTLLALIGSVQAGGHCDGCGCNGQGCYCELPPKPLKDKVYYEIKFKPQTMEVTEDKLVCTETVKQVKCIEQVPVWKEVSKCITVYHKVARECEKEVVSCHMVPECVCDPCTGCTKICYKPHTCVQKVKYCVWECVPEQKTIVEKVCTMECREKIVEQKCIVQELIEESHCEDVILVTLERYKGKPPVPPSCPPAPCVAPCAK